MPSDVGNLLIFIESVEKKKERKSLKRRCGVNLEPPNSRKENVRKGRGVTSSNLYRASAVFPHWLKRFVQPWRRSRSVRMRGNVSHAMLLAPSHVEGETPPMHRK